MMWKLLLLPAFLFVDVVGAKKVKRVKAGQTYKAHDSVHIVVNKIG